MVLLLRHQTLQHLSRLPSFLKPHTKSNYTSLIHRIRHSTTTSSWNSLIKRLSLTSDSHLSILAYARMLGSAAQPDHHTFTLLLKSFSHFRSINPFQVYCHIIKFGLNFDGFVRNSLISAFAKCGYLDFSRQVFDECAIKDSVCWTAMIDGYVRNEFYAEGLKCFVDLRSQDVMVDEVTIVSALRAAAKIRQLWFGRWIHGFYVETGRVKRDVYVNCALMNMYSKCGCCDDAKRIFVEMPVKNVVAWSSLIAGYTQCNRFKDALICFQDMIKEGIRTNQTTLTSVLDTCAHLGSLDFGRWVHNYIDKHSVEVNSILGTALIDMYLKCGCIDEAFRVFDALHEKDVYSWSAMINGLAIQGDAAASLNLFSQMLSSEVEPNGVTFIGVLSACSHGGLVKEGLQCFEMMKHTYQLDPKVDHYGCIVDMLGRAGYLEEARKFIEDMPMEPTPGVWGALFAACMNHKAYELGEYVGDLLIQLQPNHSGRYALLANLYSACQKWDEAANTRKLMKGKLIEKIRGSSWIEINSVLHDFIAHDNSHTQSESLYQLLDHIMIHLKPIDHDFEKTILAFGSNEGWVC